MDAKASVAPRNIVQYWIWRTRVQSYSIPLVQWPVAASYRTRRRWLKLFAVYILGPLRGPTECVLLECSFRRKSCSFSWNFGTWLLNAHSVGRAGGVGTTSLSYPKVLCDFLLRQKFSSPFSDLEVRVSMQKLELHHTCLSPLNSVPLVLCSVARSSYLRVLPTVFRYERRRRWAAKKYS